MNNISQTLLGGVALCALATAPAMAGAISVHVAALHPGHATFVKSNISHNAKSATSTINSTIHVTTAVPSSDLHTTVKLANTYYTFYDSGSFCNSSEQQSVKLKKHKTRYAKLGTSTETLSGYCSTADTVFYGDTYDLKKRKGFGKTDMFVSTLVGKGIHYNGGIYNINVNLDVSVSIGS